MGNIIDVKKTVVKFLKENINCYDVTVIKIEKVQESWNSIAEVYENDSFLKSMNLPPKQVRLFYMVKMDEQLEITSFERLNSFEGMDSTSQS
ncbi:MAG: gas vesicle protein [Bacteroidetes bacterium]|nr:gas vesicle protein [Bacteroidota bacterium]